MDAPLIRRPFLSELASVRNLVQSVVDETYGGLWAAPPLPIGDNDWSGAWIAVAHDAAVGGVLLTSDDWIEDLWISQPFRGKGLGARLLSHGESEIGTRGFATAHLRVVASNANAISFYAHSGWQMLREFDHETFSVRMLELEKPLTPKNQPAARRHPA